MRLRRTVTTVLATVGVAGMAAFVLPQGGAYGATINVSPGQSIQAAVNAASPGDTVRVASGTFRESVEVTKSVNIIGAGQGSTILLPPASPPTSESMTCFDPSSPTEFDGFCIHGMVDSNTGSVTSPVGAVRVSGFTVKNFNGIGVVFFGATSPQVDHNTLVNNADYGTAAFVGTDDVITANIARGNGEAGIYVGDSPGARAKVTGNTSTGNDDFGIFVRDSSGPGTISGNDTRGNCGGILFLNTGSNPSNWDASGNIASANDNVCTPDGGPAVGGLGIAVDGVNSVNVHGNVVRNNVPSGPVTISGGVAVADGASQTTVTNNQIHGNSPDIFWDGSGMGNNFAGNACKTSVPSGLC